MTKISDLHKKWLEDSKYRKEYEGLEEEFALASALTEARSRAGSAQDELAARMKTSQTAIARLTAAAACRPELRSSGLRRRRERA